MTHDTRARDVHKENHRGNNWGTFLHADAQSTLKELKRPQSTEPVKIT